MEFRYQLATHLNKFVVELNEMTVVEYKGWKVFLSNKK